MPPLKGFSDNPLITRDHVVTAAEALIRPLLSYFSPSFARVRVPVGNGAHFDETAAQLEGFARPLWVVAPLLMCKEEPNWDLVQPWIQGFEAGVDPDHPEYWGPIRDHDQKMVECEMISFCLIAAPKERLWDRFERKTQENIIKWLLGIHGKAMPPANWLWFRVFANLALLKTCGVDTPAVRESMKADLELLDTLYLKDGWSGDGKWRDAEADEEEWRIYQETGRSHALKQGRNACYYSGSFAIQFSQLLYVRFAADLDVKRTERYRQKARDFGAKFWRYFDAEGAAIPFGRSLTYRFACGGFFAALALAGVEHMPNPLNTPGAVKGFLLRHLRWWTKNSGDIFYPDGTLNIGYKYPNMYMAEDYNSPQSVYWALKSFIVIGLASNDSFWSEPEAPYPTIPFDKASVLVPAPHQIVCNHPLGNHNFLLSFSQFIPIPFKGGRAKYCKFAYSSAFGFCVPNGPVSLRQNPPDNALAFSRDGGDTWATKYKGSEGVFRTLVVGDETIPVGTVSWHPWTDRSVTATTTIVPPSSSWPDWHIRVHKIKSNTHIDRVFISEGGFAIHGRQKANTLRLPALETTNVLEQFEVGVAEGIITTDDSVLVMSEHGVSGIKIQVPLDHGCRTSVSVLEPEPNTNIVVPRSVMPLAEYELPSGLQPGDEIVFITKVFAISNRANSERSTRERNLKQRWLDEPHVNIGATDLSPSDGRVVNLNL